MTAGIAFDFGWSHNRASMLAGRVAALRRQANNRFAQLDNPMDAAKRAASLRNAYPWLRPQTAAQMAAYGVDPADPAVAGVAGADLARVARRGYIDVPSRRRSTAEIANARAHPLQYAMDQYAYQNRPARPEDMGIPVGHNEDYLSNLNIGPEEMTPNLAENLTQGQRPFRERFPGMADQFASNRATFESARRIADDPGVGELSFQQMQQRTAQTDPGYAPLPGETPQQLPGQSRTSSLMVPGADPRQARELAQSLPGVDATLRHIRAGGETFRGIPLPTAGNPEAFRDVYLGPGRDQIEETFTREAERLDGLISGGHLPEEAEAQARARRANLNAALDMVSSSVQSIGPDVSTMGIPGLPDTLSIGDVLQGPGNAVHYAARGTIRAASVAMDTIWQAGQAQFRRGLTQPSTGDTLSPSFQAGLVGAGPGGPTTSAQALEETDVGIALEHWINGEPLEQGSGFFVGLDSPDALERRRRELRTGNIGGHVITMGRYAADRVGFAPDTLPFDVASGLVDATWMLAEPGGAAVDLAARSATSARLLSRIGGFTATRTLHPDRFMEAIANDTQIRQVIDHYARLDNDLDIMEARPRSMPEWAHWALADQRVVGETATEVGSDPRFVEDMLANITGMGMPSPSVPLARAGTLGRAGDPLIAPAVSWRRHINRSRLAMDVPEEGLKAVDTVNPDVVADNARRHMRSMHVPEEEIARVVGRIFREGYEYPTRVRINQLEREKALLTMTDMGPEARTVAHGEVIPVADRLAEIEETLATLQPGKFIDRPTPRHNVLHDIWYDDMQPLTYDRLIASGVEPGSAKVLNRLAGDASSMNRRNIEETGAYWLKLTGDNTAVNRDLWGVLNGEPITNGSGFAHALAEHQGRYLPLPEDWRKLARLTRTDFAKAVGSITSKQAGELRPGELRWGANLVDGFMNKIWKPSRLLRVAWPVRVVGEEQFRMAATGFDSAVSHPLHYWSLIMGTRQDGKMHRFLDALESGMFGDVADETERFSKVRAKLFGGSMTDDMTGTPFGSLAEMQEVMNRSSTSNWLIPSGAATNGRFEPYDYRRADPALGGEMTPGAFHAWNDWFARMHTDDLLRRIARIARNDDSEFATLDDLIEAGGGPARNGDELRMGHAGGAAREGKMGQNIIARSRADLMDDPKHGALGERGATGYAERLSRGDETINSWDDYIHSLAIRLDMMTGGDDSLLRAVADGDLDGIPLNRQNTTRINPAATRKLKDKYGDLMPVVLPGDKHFYNQVVGGARAGADDFLDRALERMYSWGGAIPTDRLSRSPVFRQYYYRRAQDIMPYLTPAAQKKLIAGAQLGNVPNDAFHIRLSAYIGDSENVTSPTIKSLEEAAAKGSGDLTFEMADEIAKLAALDNTRWLLYDVHKRGLFMDAMRIIFPFGEAWKEVATRWLALTAQRPGTVVARAHQVQKITQAHPWEDTAGPGGDPSGHGFFFENANGESVFTYPATRWFTSNMIGVPVELTGSLNGLSLMSSVGPGVGPVVQVGATFVPALRESPQFDKWRELIFPFGMSDLNTLPVDTILSPGARRVLEGVAMGGLHALVEKLPDTPGLEDLPIFEPVGDLAYGVAEGAAKVALLGGGDYEHDTGILNSLFDVMRYNVSTGRYTTDTPEHLQTTVEDSTEMTGALSIIRGIAQFSAPSAPIPEHYVTDENGNLLMLRALTDIYRDLQAEDYTTAAQTFLTRYGPNLSLVLQAKTVPRTSLIPSTKTSDQWLRNHPGFQEKYPTTYGLLVPGNHGPDAEFDFDAYNRAKATGATRTLGHELTVEDLTKLANDRAASIIYDQIESELLADPRYVTESGNLNEEGQHYMSVTVTEELMDSHYGFRSDDLIRGPSTQDLQRYGMDEIDTAIEDRTVDEEFRAPVAAYMAAHHQVLDLARSAEYGNAANYYESMATRPLRDYMRYTVGPEIRNQIPRGTGLRVRWDVIWDRLFDRIMLNDRAEEERPVSGGVVNWWRWAINAFTFYQQPGDQRTATQYGVTPIDEAQGRRGGRSSLAGPLRAQEGSNWDERHEIIGGYFLQPPTTVHGSQGSFGPGSAPTYTGLQDPYRAGDLNRILQNQVSQGGINDLQLSLMDAGLLDMARVTPGHLGPATVAAFKNLLSVANQNGMDWRDVLSGAIQGGGTLGSPGPGQQLPPQIVTLPSREDLIYNAEKTGMEMTGHRLDDDLQESIADAQLNALRTQQERQYQQEIGQTEGLIFREDIGEGAMAKMTEEAIRKRAPDLVAARGAQDAALSWFEAIRGPVA